MVKIFLLVFIRGDHQMNTKASYARLLSALALIVVFLFFPTLLLAQRAIPDDNLAYPVLIEL